MAELVRKATRDAFKRLILALDLEFDYREVFEDAGIKGVGLKWISLSTPPPEKYLSGKPDSHIDCYYRGIDWTEISSVRRVFKVWEMALELGKSRYEHLTYSSLQLLNLDGFIFRSGRIGLIGKPPHIYGSQVASVLIK